MSDSTTTLTAGTFDEVVNAAEKPILVDFWAEWCGPCKMIAPILEEIASEQGEHIQIAKLNVDEAGDIARRFLNEKAEVLFCKHSFWSIKLYLRI